MKNVISLRDVEDMARKGQDLRSLPLDAILTPSAREFLHDLEMDGGGAAGKNSAAGSGKNSQPAKPLTSKSPKSELVGFFNSPYALSLKEQLCDIGRRL